MPIGRWSSDGFLESRLQAYRLDDEVRFFMRMAFFPPSTLYDEVMAMVYPLLDQQELNLSRSLPRAVRSMDVSSVIRAMRRLPL